MTTLGTSDLTLATTAQTALAPSGGAQWLIVKATATNFDTAAHQVTAYRVPGGGTAGTGNVIVQPVSVAAGATVTLPLSGQAVIDPQSLQALADAAAVVNLNITYEVVT